jgi:hypothetical protein
MTELQDLEWLSLPIAVVVRGGMFGLALIVPLIALILYCGRGL